MQPIRHSLPTVLILLLTMLNSAEAARNCSLNYSRHAQMRASERHINKTLVATAIKWGDKYESKGCHVYYDPKNKIRVVTDKEDRTIITVMSPRKENSIERPATCKAKAYRIMKKLMRNFWE